MMVWHCSMPCYFETVHICAEVEALSLQALSLHVSVLMVDKVVGHLESWVVGQKKLL